ncbi:MAG: GNAT family N-acetyltransferase [Lachnospiraceae bacterium]|nr:GNAT family N-acetyltransferase [Lachnospiraceae bacterium]
MKGMVHFHAVSGQDKEEIMSLSAFATAIVREHFDPLIGKEQNDYMLEQFQSPKAIQGQIADGYRYYWMFDDDEPVGFIAFYPKDGKMYLSKFYVEKAKRGCGYARNMFDFLCEETKKEGLSAIFLNVFRGNAEVVHIYQHLGFQIVREEETEMGGGYRFVDYVMEYLITEGDM